MTEDPSLAFNRWPKVGWPFLAAARDLPWLLLIVFGIWAGVAVAPFVGLSYFKTVSPEEIGLYRVFGVGLLILSFGVVRTLKRLRRPISDFPSRRKLLATRTLFAPLELAVWTAASALRFLPLALAMLALTFPGILLGGWPEQPPFNFIPLSVAILAGVAAGALVIGIRRAWDVTHADRKSLGPLARACAWLAAAVALAGLGLPLALGEIARAEFSKRTSLEQIAEGLRSPYVPIRIAAGRQLHRLSTSACLDALRDPNRQVRELAVSALKSTGAPAALPALIEAAAAPREFLFGTDELTGRLRYEISAALEAMDPKSLLHHLDHPSARVRSIVLLSLDSKAGCKVVPIEKALHLLESGDKNEHRHALWLLYSLCRARPDEVVPLILERAPPPTGERRKEYAHLFRECGPRAAAAADLLVGWTLGAEPRELWSFRDALVSIGPAAYEAIQTARRTNRDAALQRLDDLLAQIPRPAPSVVYKGPAEEVPVPRKFPEAPPGLPVRVRLTYDSRDFAEEGAAEVQVWDELRNVWVKARLVEPQSLYEAKNISPGRCRAHVNFKVGDVAYFGYKEQAITPEKNAPIEVELRRRFRLIAPSVPGPVPEKVETFPPPVRFSWESLGQGVEYRVMIRGTTLHSYKTWNVRESSFDFDGDPGAYEMDVHAFRGGKQIGTTSYAYRTKYIVQGVERMGQPQGTAYRFKVLPLEGTPSTVNARFLHQGRPIQEFTSIPCTGSLQDRYWNRPSGLRVANVPGGAQMEHVVPGVYELQVTLDADPTNPPGFPGDYVGRLSFALRPDRNPERVVVLTRVIRLLQPEDSARNVLFYASKAGPPVLRSPVDFEWEPMGNDVEYEVYVPGVQQLRTREPRIRLDLAPRPEAYSFSLKAFCKGALVGDLLLGGEQRGSQYLFTVSGRKQ